MQFEKVNVLTNMITDTNNLANPGGALPGQGGGLGAGGAAITNFVGVMEDEVWASTNHAYLAYPIVLQTNSLFCLRILNQKEFLLKKFLGTGFRN